MSSHGFWIVSRLNIWNIRVYRVISDRREWCPGGGAGKPKTSPTRPRQFRNDVRTESHVETADFVTKKNINYPSTRGRVCLTHSERARCLWKSISSLQRSGYPRSLRSRGVTAPTWRSGFRTAWSRSAMPDLRYERLSTSDEPLDDDNSPRSRSRGNASLAKYLLLALTFVVVAFCSFKAGQWSGHPQQPGGDDINTGIPKTKPDNSSTDTPTMPGNGKYSVG